ncbi:unnamed protein product [Rotaria magnacalcarata]|uniref:HAT C-terminal dimerisation domain-containing protein n=1 Tax=Rotaria magnacalcarata TaxID=392030 RepID=A0A819WNA8_9BILA|nr:unnamed protein product [Rotaria magnacalcarata]
MSTFLHPSLKQFQIAPHEKQKAIDLVKAEILNRQSSRTSEPTIINNDSPATKLSTTTQSQQLTATRKAQNILGQCFDLPNEDEDSLVVSSPDKELTEYIDSNDVLDLNDDVLMYWKKHQNAFPILSSIVATLYSIPASNTTVERLFSLVGNTISDRRTNLKPEKELDHQRQQLVNVQEKRKLAQSSTLSSSNNVCNHDEQGPLSSSCSSSSSTTKKVRTFNDDIFSDEEIINKHKASICVFTEVGELWNTSQIPHFNIFHQHGTNKSGGVSIAIGKHLKGSRIDSNIENAIIVDVDDLSETVRIIAIYWPAGQTRVLGELESYITKNTIITCDFNASVK